MRFPTIIVPDATVLSPGTASPLPVSFDEMRSGLGLDDLPDSDLSVQLEAATGYIATVTGTAVKVNGYRLYYDGAGLSDSDCLYIPGFDAVLLGAESDGLTLPISGLRTRKVARNGGLIVDAARSGWPDEWLGTSSGEVEVKAQRGIADFGRYPAIQMAATLKSGDLFDRLDTNAQTVVDLVRPYSEVANA